MEARNPTSAERDERLRKLRDEALTDPEVPGAVRTFLERGAKLDDIRLDARGRWWHEHGPVEHVRVARLFASSLRRTDRGTWILEVAPYTYPVTVEGCGWFVDRFPRGDAADGLRLTDGREFALGEGELWTDGDTFVGWRLPNGGPMARFIGSAHSNLLTHLVEDAEGWVAVVGGARLRVQEDPALGRLGDSAPKC